MIKENTTLFVVAAHVPDAANAALLTSTLLSIHEHHTSSPILVVDNASPSDGVSSTIAALPQLLRSRVVLSTQRVSRGQVGSWQVADALLGGDVAYALSSSSSMPAAFVQHVSAPNAIEKIVLLQHSTRLVAPLPRTLPHGCHAIAVGGALRDTSTRAWLSRSNTDMRWASQRANMLRVPCGPTCAQERAQQAQQQHSSDDSSDQCPRWETCSDWSTALHAAIALDRVGWSKLRRYGLWPQPARLDHSGVRSRAEGMRHAEGGTRHAEALRHTAFSRAVWSEATGPASLRSMHSGIEILSGILLAHINGWPSPVDRCACEASWCVEKRHGSTKGARTKLGGASRAL